MFEHSLYEPKPETAPHETAHPASQEGDLFHRYEIKNWDLSPRIFKILGIAALVNVLMVIVFGQGAFLTMKGCDSPLVGGVCQVLDTVYVSAMIYGTESDYVDEPYDQTDLENAEVTFVDVSGVEEPMTYPVSYVDATTGETVPMFPQEAPPPEMAYTDPGYVAPGIPTTPYTAPPLIDTPQTLPKQNDNVVDGTLPNGFGGIASNPTNRKGGRGGRVKPPLGDEDDTAIGGDEKKPTDPNPTVEPTAPLADVEINKRPFVDLSTYINELLDKNQVKLETPFLMDATGKIGKDGKLDPKTFKYLKLDSPDPRMIEVIKQAVEAMNQSGYLQYLNMLEGKTLTFRIQQDDQNVIARVESQFENDLRPKTVSTLLNAFIGEKKKAKEAPEADQNDKDDLVLLQNATATPAGKKLVLSFVIPKGDLQKMVQRKLAEQKAVPKSTNGNPAGNNPSNTAQK